MFWLVSLVLGKCKMLGMLKLLLVHYVCVTRFLSWCGNSDGTIYSQVHADL
jgi:hypothetical protein